MNYELLGHRDTGTLIREMSLQIMHSAFNDYARNSMPFLRRYLANQKRLSNIIS